MNSVIALFASLLGAVVGLIVLYWVIRLAVVAALRQAEGAITDAVIAAIDARPRQQ